MRERIFAPLEMNDSGYDRHENVLERRADGYLRAGSELRNAPFFDMSIPYAAGALYSTVRDLHRWDRGLRSGKLLSAETTAKMFTPGKSNYAYGWRVKPGKNGDVVQQHSGGIPGFNTLLVRVPSKRRLVVLLNNTGKTQVRGIAERILDVLDDE